MGQDNGEAMAHVGVRLTAQLGAGFLALAFGVTLATSLACGGLKKEQSLARLAP